MALRTAVLYATITVSSRASHFESSGTSNIVVIILINS